MAVSYKRGAIPTPRHVLAAAVPFRPTAAPPAQFATVPKQLAYWGNDVYGDCVTAEEAFAKAASSIQMGLPELFVPTQEVENWASNNGVLNGAGLTEVMQDMAQSGFYVNGQTYGDGPYSSVDYSNEAVLQAAIAQGPVKIGIDASALPSGAGNGNGWYATGGSPGEYGNEDHCVSLTGYGSAQYLFAQLGVPLPAGLSPSQEGYLLFTWSSIGFVDHAWIMSTCGEAWLRSPTTTGLTPPSPPTPIPTPTPPSPPSPSPAPSPAPCPVPTPDGPQLAAVRAMVAALRQRLATTGTIDWNAVITAIEEIVAIIAQLFPPPAARSAGGEMETVMSLIRDLACSAGCTDKVIHQLASCCKPK